MKSDNCIIDKVGTRGTLFVFDDLDGLPTTVYLIEGAKHLFVCDTFLGPARMTPVLANIKEMRPGKPVVVFNTHYHWDHIWGNCAFPGAAVVSHSMTRAKMAEVGAKELEAYERYRRGQVELVLPDQTFDSRLNFEEDGVEFFHSPGHTEDSASCYDRIDQVLLVGDNVELPLPYLYWNNLERYLKTLEGYLKLGAKRVIAGHHPLVTGDIIRGNIEYLKDFASGRAERYLQGESRNTHAQNISVLGRHRENN